MIVIRGIYNGKTIRPAPDEPLPEVEGEVPVEIRFPTLSLSPRQDWRKALNWLRQKLDSMETLPCSTKELVEYERSC